MILYGALKRPTEREVAMAERMRMSICQVILLDRLAIPMGIASEMKYHQAFGSMMSLGL
jgi:hypothetical protein